MSTPGVPSLRHVASTSLLALVAGLLVAPAAGSAADPVQPLRLQPVEGSGVAELTEPLPPLLQPRPRGARRTPRLATTGHSMVALTWRGVTPDLAVRSRSGGSWGRWLAAPPIADLPDATEAAAPTV